jgi:hypothetical protein
MMLSRWQCQAGADQVVFRYGGFRGYPLLLAISAATLLMLLCAEVAPSKSPPA